MRTDGSRVDIDRARVRLSVAQNRVTAGAGGAASTVADTRAITTAGPAQGTRTLSLEARVAQRDLEVHVAFAPR